MATLRALECLVAVADSGSITEAARLLFLSQPAVSHQLGLIESEVGTPLFHREARGVRLTPAGRASLAAARRAVDAAQAAVRSARAVGRATGGTLRIACAQSLVSVLAPVLREWHVERPDVLLTVRESTSVDQLHGLLAADEVDAALMPAFAADRNAVTPIADEEIVLVAPLGHRLAERRAVRMQDLDGEALVHFAPENGLSVWLDRALARAGVRPSPVMRTAVTSAAPVLAGAGLGVAVCPVSAVADGFPGAVRSFAPRWVRQVVAVTPGPPDPLLARFLDDLRRHGVPVPAGIREQLTTGDPA